MERTYNILYLGVAYLLPFLFGGHYFFLLSCLCTLLNGYEIFLLKDHSFLRGFNLYSLADTVLFIEILGVDGLLEFDQEEGFVFVFE